MPTPRQLNVHPTATALRWLALAALCGSLAIGCGKKPETPTPEAATTEPVKTLETETPKTEKGEAEPVTPQPQPVAGLEKRNDRAEPEVAKTPAVDAEGILKPGTVEPPPVGLKDGKPAQPQVAKVAWLSEYAKLTPGEAVALGDGPQSHESLRFLPNSTLGVALFANPRATLDKLGYAEVIAYYGDRLSEQVAQMKAMTGHNLFDLDSYAKMGIDVTKPAGFALLGVEPDETVAFVLTLTSPETFNTWFDAAMKRLDDSAVIVREKVGDATVIAPAGSGDDGRLVIRGNTLFAVAGPAAKVSASVIATQGAATSLAQANEFVAAVKPLATTTDGVGWLNVKYFGAAENRMWRDRDSVPSYRKGEYAALDALLEPVTGLGMGLEIRDRAVEFVGFLPAKKGSIYLTLFKNGAGSAAAFRATEKTPVFAAAANVDLKRYLALAERMMAAQGQSMAEVREQLKTMVGLDLDEDIIGAFTGQVGVVADVDFSNVNDADAVRRSISGAVAYGLSKPDDFKKVMTVLTELMTSQLGDSFPGEVDAASGRVTIPLPTGHTAVFGVFGDQALAASSLALAERVAKPDSTTFVAGITHPDLKTFMSRADNAGVGILSQAVAAGFLMAKSQFDDEEPDPANQMLVDAFSTIGHTGFSMKVEDGGLSGRFAQFPTKAVKAVVLAMTKLAHTLSDSEDAPQRDFKAAEPVHAKEKAPEPVKVP